MLTKITVYICFVLICGHRSDSSSSSISMEDSVHTQDRIGLLIPGTPEFPKEHKKTQVQRAKHERNTSDKQESDILKDDFNINVENINPARSEFDYERDSQNTPKLQIFKLKSNIYPHTDKNNKFTDHLTVHQRVHRHNTHNPPEVVQRAHKYTKMITDFEPETPKKLVKKKRKHVKPQKAVSDELDTANAKFLAKINKAKKSKKHKSSEISMDDMPETRKDKSNNFNKHKPLKNHSNSQNKHNQHEVRNHKKYDKNRHSQPASDKEKLLSTRKKQNKRKKIKSSSDVLSDSAHFIEPNIKKPGNLRVNKNFPLPNPRKNEFTLTISDMDDNGDNMKDINVPYSPLEDSPLLNVDISKYQRKHKAEPHELMKQSLRGNKDDNVKSVDKDSKIEKQKPIEIGMIDIPEQFDDKLYDKIDAFVDNIKSEHKAANVEDFYHKRPDTEHVIENKPVQNVDENLHLQLKEPDGKLENKHNTPLNENVMKKNFDASLKVYKKETQTTKKQEVKELNDNFSKAEILLTDNEKDKLPEFDDANEKTALRHSVKKDKRWTGCFGKKALKICLKACRGAYTNVCKRVKCSSHAKRDLRYECKRNCKRTFGTSKYSSEFSGSSSSASE